MYDIVKFIGNGSYGVVFSAVDKKTGEKCAIKVVNCIFTKDFVVDIKKKQINYSRDRSCETVSLNTKRNEPS